jgi:signal transduction histidine kinase
LLLSGIAMLVIFAVQYLSVREVDLALEKSIIAGDITAGGVSGLRNVTMDYVLTRQPRALQQWQQRYASMRPHLETAIFHEDAEQIIVARLRARHDYLGEIFPKLTGLHAERSAGAEGSALQREVEARLVTQIMVATQDMVTDANLLLRMANAHLDRIQRRTGLIVSLVVGAMGLFVVLNMMFAVRSVLIPVGELQRGAERVGSGDLAYRTNIRLDNEIGALSRAFDAMTAKLAQTQAELEGNALQLRETVRELESFSYSVSHDLRAPLRGIDGWSLALQEDYGAVLDAQGRQYLDIVRAEAQRMGQLIEDLLQLSRVARGELVRAPVDLSALAQSVARRLKDALPDRRIEFVIQPGLAADADARLLEVALTNLLDNGCKFSAARENARVEFGRSAARDPVTQETKQAYFVRDNGVGFDTTHAAKLFGAFQRLHAASEFPGSGIGLATVQRIVHRHGGRIWAEAQPDQGASFYFTLGEEM